MSLVEVMIGLVIGMIVILVVYQVEATFEGQKRTTTDGAGAQENGLYAVTTLERDIRMTGWGISNSPMLGCTGGISAYYNGSSLTNFSLMPVKITDGAKQSDSIELISGTSLGSLAPTTVTNINGGGHSAIVDVASQLGFNIGDFVLVANADGTCTYGRLTMLPSSNKLQRNPGGAFSWNPNDGIRGAWPPETVGAKVYNLGNTLQRKYQVASNSLQSIDFPSVTPLALADNIVSMKAQYGITDPSPASQKIVKSWVNATGGTWSAPTVADIGRILAVRLFVVARSPIREKKDSKGICKTTTVVPKPTWSDGDVVTIDLSTNIPDWQCYRYKNFQTVVPLRNLLWAK